MRAVGTYDLLSDNGTSVPSTISPPRQISCDVGTPNGFLMDSLISGRITLSESWLATETIVAHGRPFNLFTTPAVYGEPTIQTCVDNMFEWQLISSGLDFRPPGNFFAGPNTLPWEGVESSDHAFPRGAVIAYGGRRWVKR
jgi:hypothetical protein